MPTRRTVIAGALAASAGFRSIAQRAKTRLPAGRTAMRRRGRSFSCSAAISRSTESRPPSTASASRTGTFGITTDVGKPFRVRVENGIDEPSLIHWHGLTPPWQQDGVPGISGPPIPPGGSSEYDFPLRFWRHLLDAFAPGATGAAADGSAADHPGSARPPRPAGASSFQLHTARPDICGAEEE